MADLVRDIEAQIPQDPLQPVMISGSCPFGEPSPLVRVTLVRLPDVPYPNMPHRRQSDAKTSILAVRVCQPL